LLAAGFADFPLIAFHFEKTAVTTNSWIPILYAVAMAVDALAALLFGRLYDRLGMSVLVAVAALSACFAPLSFSAVSTPRWSAWSPGFLVVS
jgi:MFS family permease